MVGGAAAVAQLEIARGRVCTVRGAELPESCGIPEQRRSTEAEIRTRTRGDAAAWSHCVVVAPRQRKELTAVVVVVVVVHAHGRYTMSCIRHTKHKKQHNEMQICKVAGWCC